MSFMEILEILEIIKNDDVDTLRTISFSNADCYITHAVITSSVNTLKYFLEEMKMKVPSGALTYAFDVCNIHIFLYLVKTFKPRIDISSIIFSHCFSQKRYLHKFEQLSDTQDFENTFAVKVPEGTNIKLRLIVALCTALSYTLTYKDIQSLVVCNIRQYHLSAEDFYFIIQNVKMDPLMSEHAMLMYGTDFDLQTIKNLHPYFTTSVTNKMIKSLPFEYKQVQEKYVNNLINQIRKYGIELNDEFPFFKFKDNFELILKELTIPYKIWFSWIKNCIHRIDNCLPSVYHLQLLLQYNPQFIKDTSKDSQRELFIHTVIHGSLDTEEIIDMLLILFPSLNAQKWLQWITIVKLIGLHQSEYLKEQMCVKYEKLINFKVIFPSPLEDKWVWYKVKKDFVRDAIYIRVPYQHYTSIHPEFMNIKTIANIKTHMQFLKRYIQFHQGCDFYFEGEIFYQHCGHQWALEKDTGRVYMYDSHNLFIKEIVAASVPEFLSRIEYDFRQFAK